MLSPVVASVEYTSFDGSEQVEWNALQDVSRGEIGGLYSNYLAKPWVSTCPSLKYRVPGL